MANASMLLPFAVFAGTFVLFFGLMLLGLASGRNSGQDLIPGYRRRPPIFGGLTSALSHLLPSGQRERDKLSRFLRQAGHYHRTALMEYLALRNALVLGWGLLVLSFIALATEPGDGWLRPVLIVGAIGGVAFFAVPRLILESLAKSRVERVERDLPDALDMITMCMSGGLSLPVAMDRVSSELCPSHPDLAYELRIVGRQMEAGSLEGAVQRFAERIDTTEVQSLAAMIGQTQTHGASVVGAFQDFADDIREVRRQRADEQGNKTAIKMLFPLVFCLAPPVYLLLLAPAGIELSRFVKRETQAGGVLASSPDELNAVIGTTGSSPAGDTIYDLPSQ
jgi:tight adherence protein C